MDVLAFALAYRFLLFFGPQSSFSSCTCFRRIIPPITSVTVRSTVYRTRLAQLPVIIQTFHRYASRIDIYMHETD